MSGSILEKLTSRSFWTTVSIRVILYIVLFAAGIFVMENYFIYHPVRHPEGNWEIPEIGRSIQDVRFRTSDGIELHGWWAPRKDTNRTILWFHGNAGNLSHRYQGVLQLHRLGCQVLIIDYRGYGKSDGSPSENGLYRDGEAAYTFLTDEMEIAGDEIVPLGRSLGSAVATHLAKYKEINRLILVSPFTNVRDMVPHILPIPGLHYLVSSEFDSLSRIQKIQVPLLFIHGAEDDIIPIELGRKLFEHANPPKTFEEIEGAGHNNISIVAGKRYARLIKQFVFDE